MTRVDYKDRRDYVASLNYALRVFPMHEGVAYVNTEENKEYVKIWDQIGGAVYLDVTNMECYQIFDSIALCMRNEKPTNMLGEDPKTYKEDVQIMYDLVHLFRQEVARQREIHEARRAKKGK